jgi:RNA polymerase sigma-70 factor (ECF subfamily)
MMGDERLVEAVAAGDGRALRELFDRHAPWLAARLRRTMPAHAVEDVLQETFIAVWRGAKGYKGEGAAGAWIWGIARRQAALWARKNGRPEIDPEPAGSEDPASAAASGADLDRALAGLGPEGGPQRELVRLIFVEDRSVADVAAAMGIPEGTVKSRAYRIRRLLRAALVQGEYR